MEVCQRHKRRGAVWRCGRPQPRCGWMGLVDRTQGRPRASANPGLEGTTPLALAEALRTRPPPRPRPRTDGLELELGLELDLELGLGLVLVLGPTASFVGKVPGSSRSSTSSSARAHERAATDCSWWEAVPAGGHAQDQRLFPRVRGAHDMGRLASPLCAPAPLRENFPLRPVCGRLDGLGGSGGGPGSVAPPGLGSVL